MKEICTAILNCLLNCLFFCVNTTAKRKGYSHHHRDWNWKDNCACGHSWLLLRNIINYNCIHMLSMDIVWEKKKGKTFFGGGCRQWFEQQWTYIFYSGQQVTVDCERPNKKRTSTRYFQKEKCKWDRTWWREQKFQLFSDVYYITESHLYIYTNWIRFKVCIGRTRAYFNIIGSFNFCLAGFLMNNNSLYIVELDYWDHTAELIQ